MTDTQTIEVTKSTFPETAGNYVIIDGDYGICCNTGTHLNLVVGFTKGKDPKLNWPKEFINMEFKHYHANGHKSWTSEEGVEYTFRVPRSKIHIVKENGYSYPKIEIGGRVITLNTSGGSGPEGGPGWVDWIGCNDASIVHTLVNMPKIDWQAILDAAEKEE